MPAMHKRTQNFIIFTLHSFYGSCIFCCCRLKILWHKVARHACLQEELKLLHMHALVQKATELFHSNETGCQELLSVYLRSKHSETAPPTRKVWMQRFVGNYWNNLFTKAGLLYLYKDDILGVFQDSAPANK